MRFLAFIFTLFFITQTVWSQQTISSGRLDVTEVNNDLLYGTTDITGNPYLADDFAKATLFLSDNSSKYIEEAKFDICNQKLLIIYKGKEMNLNDNILNGFALEIGGETRHFYKFFPDNEIQYLERLADGNYSLFKSANKNFNAAKQSDQLQYGDSDYKKPYFSKGETKYYSFNEGKLKEFNPSKKGVLEIVPIKKQKSLASAIKSRKIRVGSDSGLVKLFQYLNRSSNSK